MNNRLSSMAAIRVLTGTLFDDDQVALCADEVPVGSWSRHRAWRSPRCTAAVTVTMRQASTHGPRAGEVHVRRAAASLGALASWRLDARQVVGPKQSGPLVGPTGVGRLAARWLTREA